MTDDEYRCIQQNDAAYGIRSHSRWTIEQHEEAERIYRLHGLDRISPADIERLKKELS